MKLKTNKMTGEYYKIMALSLSIACTASFSQAQADDKVEKKRNKADCENCQLSPPKKGPPRDEERGRPRLDRPEHPGRKSRPDRPSEARGPRDMPQEAREFSERIRDFHQKIGKLHREGNKEAANDVTNELREFIKDHAELARRIGPGMRGPGGRGPDHQPPSPGADMERVRDELQKAEKGGRREDAEKLRHHLARMEEHHAKRPGGPQGEAHEVERRVHHLHQAAENLEQAGMQEEAKKIHQHAERMEQEFHQRRKRAADRPHGEQLQQEVHELHKMVGRLKKEIDQLKKELHKKNGKK